MYRVIPFALVVLLTACSSGEAEKITSQDGEVSSSISATNQSTEELAAELAEIEKEEEQRMAEEKANSTSLKFDKLKHDFGDVLPDSDNTTAFTVTNTGDKPLIISSVEASCGCTTPKKPEDPILPGETDIIEVTFHPKPEQVNEIKKTVTVTSNTMEKIHLLEIRAFVKK